MSSHADRLDRIKDLLDQGNLDPRKKSRYIYNEATQNLNPPWTRAEVNKYLRSKGLPEVR